MLDSNTEELSKWQKITYKNVLDVCKFLLKRLMHFDCGFTKCDTRNRSRARNVELLPYTETGMQLMMRQLKLHFTRQNEQINSVLLQLYCIYWFRYTNSTHLHTWIFLYMATAIANMNERMRSGSRSSTRLPVLSALFHPLYYYILLKANHVCTD